MLILITGNLKKVWGIKLEFGWVSSFVTINRRKYWVLILGGGGTTLIFLKNRVSHLWSCILYRWSPPVQIGNLKSSSLRQYDKYIPLNLQILNSKWVRLKEKKSTHIFLYLEIIFLYGVLVKKRFLLTFLCDLGRHQWISHKKVRRNLFFTSTP